VLNREGFTATIEIFLQLRHAQHTATVTARKQKETSEGGVERKNKHGTSVCPNSHKFVVILRDREANLLGLLLRLAPEPKSLNLSPDFETQDSDEPEVQADEAVVAAALGLMQLWVPTHAYTTKRPRSE
jgi:hypothetical protein